MTTASFCPVCASPVTLGQARCVSCGAALGSQTLAPGTVLQGKYRVERVLGQGGFGVTYAATQVLLGARVALKELFPTGAVRQGGTLQPPVTLDAAGWRQAKHDFTEEGRVLARFNHPDIVRVTDFFEEHGTAYLVMEYLEGETLMGRLEREGALPPDAVADIAARVLRALALVHSVNLLHRDLKPDNIFLDRAGRVVLIDFGSARDYTAGKTVSHTRLVTPGYAPLEQYGTAARFGPYTDIYALGATLFHALTGQAPPAATDRMMGTPLPALPAATPPGLRQAVLRSLEVKVGDRPQSCQDVLNLIATAAPAPAPTSNAFPAPTPGPAPAPPPPVPVPPPAPAPRRGFNVWPLLTFVLLGGGGYYAYSHGLVSFGPGGPDSPPPAERNASGSGTNADAGSSGSDTTADASVPDGPPIGEVVTTAANLNLRAGPGTGNAAVAVVPGGTSLTALREQDGWYEVAFEGQRGWVSAKHALPVLGEDEVQDFVRAAHAGGTVELRRGVYRLPATLTLDTSVSLRGQGRDSTVLMSDASEDTIVSSGVDVEYANLTVMHAGRAFARVVRADGGSVTVRQARFSGGVRDESVNEYGSGLWLKDGAQGDVADSEFVGNAYGAYLTENSTIKVTRSGLSDNSLGGAMFKDTSGGEITDCAFDRNGVHGVHVFDEASPTITDSKIRDNRQRGVSVYGKAAPTLRGNGIENNGTQGVGVQDEATPTIADNRIQGNKGTGLTFFDNAQGDVTDNTVQGNKKAGVALTEYSRPSLSGNLVRANGDAGLTAQDHATVDARVNTFEANAKPGVAAWGDTELALEDNVVRGNKQSGIVLADRVTGTLKGNTVERNALYGVVLTDAVSPALTENRVLENSKAAIFYKRGSGGSATGNSCEGNGADIALALDPDNAGPELDANSCDTSTGGGE